MSENTVDLCYLLPWVVEWKEARFLVNLLNRSIATAKTTGRGMNIDGASENQVRHVDKQHDFRINELPLSRRPPASTQSLAQNWQIIYQS